MSFIRNEAGIYVPLGAVELDYSHPMADGVVSAYVPGSANGFRDLGPAGVTLNPETGCVVTMASYGPGAKNTGANQSAFADTPASQQIQPPLSLFYFAESRGNRGADSAEFWNSSFSGGAAPYASWSLSYNGATDKAALFVNNTASWNATVSATDMPSAGIFSLAGTQDASNNQKVFLNGRLDASGGGAGGAILYTGPKTSIGASFTASTRFNNKIALACYLFRRVLQPNDVAWLHDEPFGMFRPVVRRKYYLASGDVSVALTGQVITLSAGTILPSTAVPASGQNITLAQGTVVPALSVAAAGVAVTYAQGTISPATAISLNGAAATYAQGTLTPQTSVALTGETVTYSQGIVLVPGDVTVALSGLSMAYAQGTLTASVAVVNDNITGGWVDPRIVRQVLRRAKAYHKAAEEERADREARRTALFETLERVYAEATGEALPATAEAVAAEVAKPAETPPERVAQAVAVYAAVARMDDGQAMRQALARLDKELIAARVAATQAEEAAILRMSEEYDRAVMAQMMGAVSAFLKLTKEANANLRLQQGD